MDSANFTVRIADNSSIKTEHRRSAIKWLRKIVTSKAIISVALLSGSAVFISSELAKARLDLLPISLPATLSENGVTPEVAARRLVDQVRELVRNADPQILYSATGSPGGDARRGALSLPDTPVDFTVPGIGVSATGIAGYVRQMLGMPSSSVIGEIVIDGDTQRLRLRSARFGASGLVEVSAPRSEGIDALLHNAALEVVRYTNPYAVAVAAAQRPEFDPYEVLDLAARAEFASHELRGDAWLAVLLRAEVYWLRLNAPDRAGAELERARRLGAPLELIEVSFGRLALVNGSLQEAERRFHRALRLNRHSANVYAAFGTLHSIRGHRQRAIWSYRKALSLTGSWPWIYLNLAEHLHAVGRDEEAERAYRQSIIMHPRIISAYVQLGNLMLNQSRRGEAASLYREAIRLEPFNPIARGNLAAALIYQDQYEEAEELLREGMLETPDAREIHDRLHALLKAQGRDTEAEEMFRRALMAQTEGGLSNAAVILNLLWALQRYGYTVMALDFAEEIKLWAFNDTNLARGLANILGGLDSHESALLVDERTARIAERARRDAAQQLRVRNVLVPADTQRHSGNAIQVPGDDFRVEIDRRIARRMVTLGNPQGAVDAYERILSARPADQQAVDGAANLYVQLGLPELAIASYQDGIRAMPDLVGLHGGLGNLLRDQLHRPTEAEASYREALRLDPDYVHAHNGLGNVLRDAGRLDEAEASFREALRLDPDYVHAHNGLGNTMRDKGRLDEAEASYREALRLDPDYVHAHNGLGNILRDKGRLDEAEASFREALRLDPDYVHAHNGLGNTMRDKGRLDEAEASYRTALRLDPNYVDAHNGLANIHWDRGDLSQAEVGYRHALTLSPPAAYIRVNLGNLLTRTTNRLGEAREQYLLALQSDPNNIRAHRELVQLYKAQGERDDALKHARRLRELAPSDEVDALIESIERLIVP